MRDHIRDVAIITFLGPRFDDGGLALEVFPELLAYQKLLLEIARRLWRSEIRDLRRLPKGFWESLRLRCYLIDNKGSATISLKRVVHSNEMRSLNLHGPDEIDDAAQLIGETIEAIHRGAALPEWMPQSVLPLFGRFGATLNPDETLRIQAARNLRPVEFTHDVRERIRRLIEVGHVGSRTRKMATQKIPPPEYHPELQTGTASALSDAVAVQPRPTRHVESYNWSAPPIWESLAVLGGSVPAEAWDRVPVDLSTNLDRYLYDKTE